MLSLTLHSLLNASIVRYNYNSYFITVFSLHWPLRVLYWERCLLVRCVFILYFYHLFVFCGRVFFLDWDVGCVATIFLIFSRSHVSHTSTAFGYRFLNEETTHTNIHLLFHRLFFWNITVNIDCGLSPGKRQHDTYIRRETQKK